MRTWLLQLTDSPVLWLRMLEIMKHGKKKNKALKGKQFNMGSSRVGSPDSMGTGQETTFSQV